MDTILLWSGSWCAWLARRLLCDHNTCSVPPLPLPRCVWFARRRLVGRVACYIYRGKGHRSRARVRRVAQGWPGRCQRLAGFQGACVPIPVSVGCWARRWLNVGLAQWPSGLRCCDRTLLYSNTEAGWQKMSLTPLSHVVPGSRSEDKISMLYKLAREGKGPLRRWARGHLPVFNAQYDAVGIQTWWS